MASKGLRKGEDLSESYRSERLTAHMVNILFFPETAI